jgi:hypothetical protein
VVTKKLVHREFALLFEREVGSSAVIVVREKHVGSEANGRRLKALSNPSQSLRDILFCHPGFCYISRSVPHTTASIL